MGLEEVVVGEDPSDIEALWDKMYNWTFYYGRRGVVIHAISGVDLAHWDLKGKAEGKPVHALLGKKQRASMSAPVSG